jgi:membrane dipeptidase
VDAHELHRDAIVIDGLNISNWSREVLEAIHKGGITAVNATTAVLEGFRQTISNLVQWERFFENWGDIICKITRVDDIFQAKKTHKTGIILGFQNSSPVENDLDLLTVFHRLGVRIIQLTYMEANLAGCGCLERNDGGLTDFGIEMVEEMNRLGILVDLSHVAYRTSMDAVRITKKPVALTHANPSSLVDHKRNKPDDLIKAVAERGGIIGATIFPPFLKAHGPADLSDFVRVIDYLVNLVGIEHVGIGTDFTENQGEDFFRAILTGNSKKGPKMSMDFLPVINPKGIESAREFPNITAALVDHGYPESHVRKIMGENFMRVFREVW